jgi:hypothetical protein
MALFFLSKSNGKQNQNHLIKRNEEQRDARNCQCSFSLERLEVERVCLFPVCIRESVTATALPSPSFFILGKSRSFSKSLKILLFARSCQSKYNKGLSLSLSLLFTQNPSVRNFQRTGSIKVVQKVPASVLLLFIFNQ